MAEGYRAEPEGLSSDPEGCAVRGGDWAIVAVRERLAEAVAFERRLPGGGGSPYAGDGPWHLATGLSELEHAEQLLAGTREVSIGRIPLRTAEVERMREAIGWLDVVEPENRRLVWAAAGELASWGERPNPRINWERIAERGVGLRTATGQLLGPAPLEMRFRRSIERIRRALNRGYL